MKDNNTQTAVIELVPFSQQTAASKMWQDLEQRIGNTGLTNSWPWIQTWLDNYSDTVQPTFIFAKLDDQPIGAALITKATPNICGLPIPSIYLGTAGEPKKETTFVECNQLLVAPEHLDTFALALVRTLWRQFRWSELRLEGFIPHHADALIRASASIGLPFRTKEQRKTPAFDFQKAQDEGHQDIISALGSNTRYNIRRSIRLFDSKFGRQQIEWAETKEQAKDILTELIELHQKRWQSIKMPGSFRTDRVKRYHEDLIDTLSLWPQGSLIVFRLKHGNTTIGCLFNFVDEDGHVLTNKSGIPLFEDNRLKPGFVTHVICMQECQRRSLLEKEKHRQPSLSEEAHSLPPFKKYDFLEGENIYKEQLSNTESHLTWAKAGRGLRSWLLDKAQPLFQIARELKKRRKRKKRRSSSTTSAP
jgi:CelD/BcsL family acetyltransferase involved in cellulose biosynthesis